MRALPFALSGSRRQPDPLELTFQGALPGAVGLLLAGQSSLLLLEPRRIVALPWDARPAVQLQDPAGHVVEEIAVMGDGHDGPRVVLEGAFQPGHRLGVEVVGRFVEEQEVRLRQQETAQRHPAAFPAGQCRDLGIGGREPEGVHGDVERPFEVPGAGGVDLVLEFGLLGQQLVEVGVGLTHRRTDGVEPVDQRLGFGHAVGHVAQDILPRIEVGLLGEIPHRETGC